MPRSVAARAALPRASHWRVNSRSETIRFWARIRRSMRHVENQSRPKRIRAPSWTTTTLRGIEESESRYRLLFEANPQPMWVFARDTLSFLAVNHAAITRYGYTREEFLGMTLRDIRPPEDVPEFLEHTRHSTGAPHTDGPWRHRRKD